MNVLPYNEESHYDLVTEMLALRGFPADGYPARDEMPAIGFIALSQAIPVAYMSVRKVEGGYGQLDGIVTNPGRPGQERHEAQDLLFQSCINQARAEGLKGLIGYTIANSTGERSVRHGFEKQPHTMYVLNLKA